MGHSAGGQIHSFETVHPAKLSALEGSSQSSINHSEPNVTATAEERSWHRCAAGLPFRMRRRGKVMASKPKKAERADAASDADEAGGEGGSASKRKLPLKLIIIVAAALVVLGGSGAAAFFMLGGRKDASAETAVVKPSVFFDVPEVLVNLSTISGERTQYLKVKIVLELSDVALQAQIQGVMPRVLDAFQTYLRELRPTDLDGSAGLYRLKEELTRRINAAISPSHVNAVLFKEMVIQ
jgi:flagellar FliL protein